MNKLYPICKVLELGRVYALGDGQGANEKLEWIFSTTRKKKCQPHRRFIFVTCNG